MAIFHVDVHCLSKKGGQGGGFAKYLCREQEIPGTRHSQYLIREGRDGSDLTACGYGGLPSWAKDGVHFFEMADRFERQNATVARAFQVTLPRELDAQARLALAADIRAVFFEQFPHVWAVHTPVARDGKEQPHLHVQLSERRSTDAHVRGPKDYFARAVSAGQDASKGGVRKDRSFIGQARLRDFRHEVATLINAALEREGIEAAVSAKSLQERGYEREPEYDHTKKANRQRGIQENGVGETWQTTLEKRNIRNQDVAIWEQVLNVRLWKDQKEKEGIRDISREAIIDFCRTRFWAHDQSPARILEREHAFARTFEREWQATGHPRSPQREQTRSQPRARQEFDRGRDDLTRQGVHLHFERGVA